MAEACGDEDRDGRP